MGYSLIELMIALVIIGVIAAIATVAYLDYARRTQVAVAVLETEAIRRTLDVQHATDGVWQLSNASAGLKSPGSYQSRVVRQVTLVPGNASAPLLLQVDLQPDWVASGSALLLYPSAASGSYHWLCSSSNRNHDLYRLLPSSCRD